MDELGPEEKAIFGALRAADEPTAQDRARVRARVVATIAATSAASIAAVSATSTAGTAATATKTVASAGWYVGGWKIGAAAVLLGLAGTAGYYATVHRASPADAPIPAANAAPIVAPLPTGAATATSIGETMPASTTTTEVAAPPTEARAVPSIARSAAPAKPRGAAGDDLEAEVALLATAQRGLARHAPSDALAALDEHAKSFPHGALAVEREGLRAVGSCEAKRGDGKARAEKFVARHPTSPLVARVKAACGVP